MSLLLIGWMFMVGIFIGCGEWGFAALLAVYALLTEWGY